MIPQLLSVFNKYPTKYCILSDTGKSNNYSEENSHFYTAYKILQVITIAWVIIQLFNYPAIYSRPKELVLPTHYFGSLFMPALPDLLLFNFIGTGTIVLLLCTLFYKNTIILRGLITFSLLWINLPDFSFGFQCHTAHLLILSHLFGIFIPVEKIKTNMSNKEINDSIQWFYLGILATYFFSGFWKVVGILFKIIFKPEEIHWLSQDAALYNVIASYRQTDKLLSDISSIFHYPLFWQIGVIITCYVLIGSIFSAFRHPLKQWTGLALIVFHIINSIAFDVTFITAPFVLISLFFPWHLLVKSTNKIAIPYSTNFYGHRFMAVYERNYSNGDKDSFKGFYAYREKCNDEIRIIGSLLYLPLLGSFTHAIWLILPAFNIRQIKKGMNI